MKKPLASQSGIFNLRTLTACTFFSVASLLAYFSFVALATPTTTITVNSTSPVIANDGFCTLPEAIIAANTQTPSGTMAGECPAGSSGGNTIVLATGASYILVQAHNALYGFNGLPAVTSTITISGNGAIIQNGGANKFRLFYISPSGNLTLRNLTVSGGSAQGGNGGVGFFAGGGGGGLGGAIYNQGVLTLSGVTLSGNTAQGGAGGVETASTIGFGGGSGGGGLGGTGGDNTTGYGGGGGGGFGGNGGKAGVFATTNDGGGGGGETIGSNGGDSTPLGPGAGGGTTGGAGGAFGLPGANGLTGGGGGGGGSQAVGGGGDGGAGGGGGGGNFSNADGSGGNGGIGGGGGGGSENQNGGLGGVGGGGGGSGLPGGLGIGIPGSGGFGGGNGQVAGGGGGGLGGAIFNDAGGTLTIFDSTLSGNSAVGGAGGASSTLTSGNGGSGFGGAIFNLNGTVTINFSTIASNTVTAGAAGTSGGATGLAGTAVASGVYNHQIVGGSATMNILNVILAGTGIANCANDGGAAFTSGGYNLAQTPGATCGFTATGDLTGVNPKLRPLANNGGPTNTQALQNSSQAIDRIPNGVNGCQSGVSVDQRGAPRAGGPGLGGTACDSGAYEFDSPPTQNLGGPPGPPTFGHPIISGVGGYGFEQDIRLDPTDPNIVYTSVPDTLSSDTSWIWHSRDGGKTFKWITAGIPFEGKATACAGGGDSELGVDSAGHLYFNDLTLANFSVARSDDKGVTFPCNNTGVPDTAVDRQWYAFDGDPTNGGSIYLTNDEIGPGGAMCGSSLGNNVLVMYRSPVNGVGATAGLQFGPANKVTANLSCDEGIMGNNEVSPVATTTGKLNPGPTTLPTAVKHVYVIHDNATLDQIQIGRCFPVAFGPPVVNVSDLSGLNCDNLPVTSFPGFRTGANFPTMAIDNAGNLYAVWSQAPATVTPNPMDPTTPIVTVTGDTVLMYSYSTNEGNTWSTPMQIDTSGSSAGTLHNNVFPWMGAGDDGRLDIAWYGTPDVPSGTKGPDSCTSCTWSLWMVQSLNAHAASPTFTAPILAGEHFSHRGSIQTLIGQQTGDRTLGDFLQMRIGPFGEAHISYADSNSLNEPITPHAMYVRQNGGNGVFAASSPLGIPGLTPFNSVTDPSGDGRYEVSGTTSANMPQLDIIGSSVSLLTTAPCSTAAPCYQVVMQLNNLSLAPTTAQDPDPDLVWLTQWFVPSSTDSAGGKNFFVYAESTNGGALTCYYGEAALQLNGGGALITYPGANSLDASAGPLPAANCLSTLGANGTITIDVPLSNVNEAGAIDNHLHEVTASTMTLSEPANTVPSTAGIGGVLFNLIDVAQGYTFVPSPPVLTGVVSRKTHGTLTPPGDLTLNPGTPATIECRTGGIPSGNHTLVFTFANTLNVSNPVGSITATATTSSGTQNVTANGNIGTDTHQYFVNLSGVPNASHVNVTLNNVLDSAGNNGLVSAHMDVLLGDVNSTARTDAGDVTQVRNRTVSIPDTTDPASFRYDVNASGRIDAGDVTTTRNATVTVLP
jgi:hypothetical protein